MTDEFFDRSIRKNNNSEHLTASVVTGNNIASVL